MLKKMFSFFFREKELTDQDIFEKFGTKVYIRNGVGYGFISDENLYDNGHIEIGFGRTTSGYGDWGGGFDRATTTPLKITINSKYEIIKLETDSFYNSESSQRVEAEAKKMLPKFGENLIVTNKTLEYCLDKVLSCVPCKWHIDMDVDITDEKHVERMVKSYTDPKENTEYSRFRNAKCLDNEK